MINFLLVLIKQHLAFIGLTSLLVLSLQANANPGPDCNDKENKKNIENKSAIIINDVNIFNGKDPDIQEHMNILIYDELIQKISSTTIDRNEVPAGYTLTKEIKGDGKVLIPGLIDAHWHSFMADIEDREFYIADAGYLHTRAAVEATKTLMRGYTSVRDAGGPSFGLKRAIDEGLLIGPRIYPSGAIISQTSGHGDLRLYPEKHKQFGGQLSAVERLGISLTVDGESQVLAAVREQLRKGASQIKIAVGGGAASEYDPIDTVQFTVEEIKAAVSAASDWGTYVMAHVYNAKGAQRAIDAGVKSIEHGHLITAKEYKAISDGKDIWLSTQPFMPQVGDNAKKTSVIEGTEKLYDMIKQDALKDDKGVSNLTVAFGTDRLHGGAQAQREFLGYLQYRKVKQAKSDEIEAWFAPADILTMATYNNGRLLKLSNKRDPYSLGNLGIIEGCSYADLLIMKEDPLQYDSKEPDKKGVMLFEDPETNILFIMKGGKIYKNKL
jgi:imidazolonepropionase-like amidohydrolase